MKLFGLQQQLSRCARFAAHAFTAIFTIEAGFAPELNFDNSP